MSALPGAVLSTFECAARRPRQACGEAQRERGAVVPALLTSCVRPGVRPPPARLQQAWARRRGCVPVASCDWGGAAFLACSLGGARCQCAPKGGR